MGSGSVERGGVQRVFGDSGGGFLFVHITPRHLVRGVWARKNGLCRSIHKFLWIVMKRGSMQVVVMCRFSEPIRGGVSPKQKGE